MSVSVYKEVICCGLIPCSARQKGAFILHRYQIQNGSSGKVGVVKINLFLNLKAQPETTLLCKKGICQDIA